MDDKENIEAKKGNWKVHLTPNPVKKEWLADIKGKNILCLASAGGQQAPILAAAGGIVTVFDLSEGQLSKDSQLAQKHQLALTTQQGDMADLSVFSDESFDIVFHPISNLYVPDVNPVWQECYRVLRENGLVFGHSLTDLIGGQLRAGFLLQDFVEDFAPQARFLIDSYIPTFLASKAIKI